ncbi:MAG: hypothetical protein A3E87_01705 [Gammaproteobacteria bacterium RIFCSPHIGHO2_12_FULL_35_23]|nr:MAG: hypothetical protein A3E87_01705 [Gammaproteobacteria bacterium RIFCSPHIGHO2_12_FULL_35_23]
MGIEYYLCCDICNKHESFDEEGLRNGVINPSKIHKFMSFLNKHKYCNTLYNWQNLGLTDSSIIEWESNSTQEIYTKNELWGSRFKITEIKQKKEKENE